MVHDDLACPIGVAFWRAIQAWPCATMGINGFTPIRRPPRASLTRENPLNLHLITNSGECWMPFEPFSKRTPSGGEQPVKPRSGARVAVKDTPGVVFCALRSLSPEVSPAGDTRSGKNTVIVLGFVSFQA